MTNRLFATLSFALSVLTAAYAAAPAGYYSALDGKSDETLKNQLHDIISKHTQLTYSSLWDYFPQTDAYPERVSGKLLVWDMYSDNWNNQTYFYFGGTRGLNREHSVPKSWWGNSGSSNADIEKFLAGTDITHLFPSDGSANMAKSNYPLGEVTTSKFDNGTCKVGYAESGQGGGASYVFEPADEYKGDFARVYFYMATCYQDYTWKYNYMFITKSSAQNSYLSLKPWAYNMLLDWCRKDPVSQKEIDRNEAVYKIQGNRNPFIDDPELVEYIWGNKRGQKYSADHATGTPTLISPVQNSELNFGEVAIGKSQHVDLFIKGENLVGNLTITIYRDNADMFKAQVSQISASSANAADGYKLRITYTPTATGTHSARLVVSDGGLSGSVGMQLNGSCLDIPSLSQLTANEASNLEGTSYRASWNEAQEKIDYYIITRTVYNGSSSTTEEFTADDNFYDFEDLNAGEIHTYSVQSSRLGYRSIASNVITVTPAGVTGVTADKGLSAVCYADGTVKLMCSEAHTACRIINAQGQLVKFLNKIEPNELIELPLGVYFITTDQCKRPLKVAVRL